MQALWRQGRLFKPKPATKGGRYLETSSAIQRLNLAAEPAARHPLIGGASAQYASALCARLAQSSSVTQSKLSPITTRIHIYNIWERRQLPSLRSSKTQKDLHTFLLVYSTENLLRFIFEQSATGFVQSEGVAFGIVLRVQPKCHSKSCAKDAVLYTKRKGANHF